MGRDSLQTSHHPEKINIHGGVGCKTLSGKNCSSCCGEVFKVEEIDKEPDESCRHRKVCVGCGIHNQPEQPDVCQEYHCSILLEVLDNPLITDPLLKYWAATVTLKLLKIAHRDGEITQEEYDSRVEKFKLNP